MKKKRWKLISWAFFIGYLVALVYFLLFAEMFGRNNTEDLAYRYNLVLFREIKRFWTYRKVLGMTAVLLNLVGNVVGLMPFGAFLPLLAKRVRRWYIVTCLTFLFSLVIETTQLLFKVGSFDVDDLLLNTIGGFLGYLLFALIKRMQKRKRKK